MKHMIQNNLHMLRRIYKACPSQIFWTFIHAAATALIGIYTAVFLGSMAEVLLNARSEFDILKRIGIYALFFVSAVFSSIYHYRFDRNKERYDTSKHAPNKIKRVYPRIMVKTARSMGISFCDE